MLKSYLRIVYRNLVKQRTYSLVTIFGLAIAISAVFLIFLYASFELSYDKFHQDADRIFRIRNDRIYKDIHDRSAGCPPALGPALKMEFQEILESARVFNAGFMNNIVSYAADRMVTFNQEKIFYAEPSFLKIFSFPLVKGNGESALKDPNTAILSQSSARKYFGDEDPIDKTIILTNRFGKQFCKITGIFKDVPGNSHIKFEFLISYETLVALRKNAADDWGWNAFNTYILLAPTADPHALAARFPGFIERHKNHGKDYRRQYILQSLKDIHLHSHLRFEPEVNGDAGAVNFLVIIAVLILIIAWVNYINLSTARSITRAKEVGIRKVLGSWRLQLIRQFIFESVFLNILAVIIALVMVKISLPYFNQLTGVPLTMSMSNLMKAWIWLAFLIVSGSILSAIYPAFVLSSFRPIIVLRGRFSRSSKGGRLGKVLVIFQFAISVILIVGTLTAYKQLSFMRNRDLGINIERTLAVRIPGSEEFNTANKNRFKRELLNYPSIQAVIASSTIPGQEYSNASSGIRPANSDPEEGKQCFFISVDYDYFDFFGIQFLEGRKFSKSFSSDVNEAVVLNEEAVKIFGYERPRKALEQTIIFGGLGGETRKTIGVIKNYHHKSLKDSLVPLIFTLTEGDQNNSDHYFSIKIANGNTAQTVSLVRNKWDIVFPGQPFEYFFLDESFNRQYKPDRQFGEVFGLFTLLSIIIACLGLFGVTSFTTLQRFKEIGIRKTFGASVPDIVSLFSREIFFLLGIADIIAFPIAYYLMSKWLEGFAFRTSLDIGLLLISGIIAFIIALLTSGFHTLKAAFSNPVESIMYE